MLAFHFYPFQKAQRLAGISRSAYCFCEHQIHGKTSMLNAAAAKQRLKWHFILI